MVFFCPKIKNILFWKCCSPDNWYQTQIRLQNLHGGGNPKSAKDRPVQVNIDYSHSTTKPCPDSPKGDENGYETSCETPFQSGIESSVSLLSIQIGITCHRTMVRWQRRGMRDT